MQSNGTVVRYTTDGTSPTTVGFATYDGTFRVPATCRVVSAMAVAATYDAYSEVIRILIPQKGQEERRLDPAVPPTWTQQSRLDDSGATWDFIQRLERAVGVSAFDVSLTAESADDQENVEYSGALEGGYDAIALKSVAEKLQEIVTDGSLRMAVGSLRFPTGQSLLDWLKATNQPFNLAKVVQ